MEDLGVEGRRLDAGLPEAQSHVSEVIEFANQLLTHPETYSAQDAPELTSLRHLNLDSNHMFLMLKRQLAKYYEEKVRRKRSMHPGKSTQWQDVLYGSLLEALMELTFSVDREQQLSDLDQIYKWYLEKTRLSLPQVSKTVKSFSVPKTVSVLQDNTMHGRRQRLNKQKMDAVKSIESRSPSPARNSPTRSSTVIDRTESLSHERLATSSKEDEDYNERFLVSKTRELGEIRGSATHHKLVAQWSTARSRADERLLAKAEISTSKPRVLNPRAHEDSFDAWSEASSVHGEVKCMPGLVDFRRINTLSETPAPEMEGTEPAEVASFRPMSKIERARYVHRRMFQSEDFNDSRIYSPDRLSLSFYSVSQSIQAINRPVTPVEANCYGQIEQKMTQIADIRRKLASKQISCTYRTLSDGLAKPHDLPAHLLNHSFLPSGGEYLTVNPFLELGKKKGKKGKKKKK